MRGTPVVPDLFEVDGEAARLIGSRCVSCGTLYFPQVVACRDPACGGRVVERAVLPRHGRLYSYTVQRYRPPPLFGMEPWEPYAIALVDLGEGVRVMGMVTGIAPNALAIDMAMEVVAEPIRTDEGGGAVLTYKFAPAAAA